PCERASVSESPSAAMWQARLGAESSTRALASPLAEGSRLVEPTGVGESFGAIDAGAPLASAEALLLAGAPVALDGSVGAASSVVAGGTGRDSARQASAPAIEAPMSSELAVRMPHGVSRCDRAARVRMVPVLSYRARAVERPASAPSSFRGRRVTRRPATPGRLPCRSACGGAPAPR